MWPEDLFDFVLENLAEEISTLMVPEAAPMPCDRYLARSALQKGIRRGETEIALSALANLLIHNPGGVWRDLTVIALEDVGVAGMDTVARVVAAARNRRWRNHMGGEWVVASALVAKMARDTHCQAACDLLMRLLNDPAWATLRLNALEADEAELATTVADASISVDQRAAAALALGGGLAGEQRFHQPGGVFEALGASGRTTHVVATAQAGWRITRNEMAFLLPLVWDEWMKAEAAGISDDDLPPTKFIKGVPAYAADQFTRIGQSAVRAFLAGDAEMRTFTERAAIAPERRRAAVGDLLFLLEGGRVQRRAIWREGERLRLPFRPLPGTFLFADHLEKALAQMASKAPQFNDLRQRYISSGQPAKAALIVQPWLI